MRNRFGLKINATAILAKNFTHSKWSGKQLNNNIGAQQAIFYKFK